jgi:hypothetical protein
MRNFITFSRFFNVDDDDDVAQKKGDEKIRVRNSSKMIFEINWNHSWWQGYN